MLHFGIKKLDDIIVQGRPIYILNNGGSACGYFQRFFETRLIKNLLENDNKCGVVNLSFGDEYKNLYRHQEGWKNTSVAVEQTEEFDRDACLKIYKYPLYELKIYGNKPEEVIDYVKNFLVKKVKYVLITNVGWMISEFCSSFVNKLFEIAKTSGVVFIFRTNLRGDIPEHIAEYVIDINKDDKDNIYATCLNKNKEKITSLPMVFIQNDGTGTIE